LVGSSAEVKERRLPRREYTQSHATHALRFGLLIAVLFDSGSALAGTGRQTTTFVLDADERAVCRWIEQNSRAIDESTGADVLAVRGPHAKLRKETKEGPFILNVRHDVEQHGQYRTVLLKSDNANLVSQETEIRVAPEGSGSRVTITVIATVNNHSAMAISIGIRPSLRGMSKLLERRFGSPNAVSDPKQKPPGRSRPPSQSSAQ
jgi:hypothetical protein